MEQKSYTLNDGRRAVETVKESQSEDGCVQQIVERQEEVVPMRVVERITRKMCSVPTEEKVEVFNEDGTVNTKVKTMPKSSLEEKDTTLESLVSELRLLREDMAHNQVPSVPAKAKSYLQLAKKKYVGTNADETGVSDSSPSDLSSQMSMDKRLAYLAVGIMAVALGVLMYVLMG